MVGAATVATRTYDRAVSTTPLHQAGTPHARSAVRPVRPPARVLIDLGAMYGRQAHFRRPHVLVMAGLHDVVVGELEAWVLAETGWFGACRYRVKLAYATFVEQSHLVPGWALKPATDEDIAQARMRGRLQQ
jgi:hypothetical protein